MSSTTDTDEMEFDWVQLQQDMQGFSNSETGVEKLLRKFRENPLVPIGALTTAGVLGYGLWCFRTGQRQMSQVMMRTRVAVQGFTVLALLVGVGMSAKKTRE